jgi:hypothetical protein
VVTGRPLAREVTGLVKDDPTVAYRLDRTKARLRTAEMRKKQ